MYVELGTDLLGNPEATFDLEMSDARATLVVRGLEDQGYEDVIRNMYRALALVGYRGEVGVVAGDLLGKEDKQEAISAIERVGDFEVTAAYAQRVAQEELEKAEAEARSFRKLASFLQQEGLRRGLNKEERENLTLGEVFREGEEEE